MWFLSWNSWHLPRQKLKNGSGIPRSCSTGEMCVRRNTHTRMKVAVHRTILRMYREYGTVADFTGHLSMALSHQKIGSIINFAKYLITRVPLIQQIKRFQNLEKIRKIFMVFQDPVRLTSKMCSDMQRLIEILIRNLLLFKKKPNINPIIMTLRQNDLLMSTVHRSF